jgi:hypothetical protein
MYIQNDEVEEDKMSRACSTNGGEISIFSQYIIRPINRGG